MNRLDYFCRLITESISGEAEVLEIGAGAGLCKYVQAISKKASKLVGVDPSENIYENPYVHEFVRSTFEDYNTESHFDIIYSIYVMEHIDNPDLFFKKAYDLLKPDGMMFFITPNEKNYFVFFSKLIERLQLKELWFDRVMRAKGTLKYIFKSHYLVNDEEIIRALAQEFQFNRCEVIYYDSPKAIARYFPKFLQWIPYALSSLMKHFKCPQKYYSDLIVRLTK